jgi:hypothetical protein
MQSQRRRRRKGTTGRSIVPTFTQWLGRQRNDRGLHGDLARFVRAVCRKHRCWPRRSNNPDVFVRHVTERHMERTRRLNLTTAIRQAWERYEAFIASGERLVVVQGPKPLPESERRVHHNFTLHPSTLSKIKELAEREAVGAGRVIDTLVEKEYGRVFE